MSANIRQYAVEARSTDTFGRVLCSARTNHFVVDGPV
ncbi:MAG: oxidoreductase, partial [Acidobacteria bacterium]